MIKKRLFDILVSFIGLIICFPLFIVIAVLISLFMPGPVFFCQKRIGRYGKPFIICKFRTMTVKPETYEGTFDAGDKSRITLLGRFLRHTKMDELPQLFNLIKGDMSLVGPRPEIEKWTQVYTDKWAIVHSIRPGMTDEASIEFINEEEILSRSYDPEETYRNVILPLKLELNIEYVNNRTFLGDNIIILRTIKSILFRWKINLRSHLPKFLSAGTS
jgi:lipopolysaccharide/colanic/teichoic acid biosynthesis glycosyltransferase